MNAENYIAPSSCQKMTGNDSQLKRTDQFKVPHVQTSRLKTKLNCDSQSKKNEVNYHSVIQSRIVRRSDYPSVCEETNESIKSIHEIMSTPALPIESQQTVFTQFNFKGPLAENDKSFVPEYVISQRTVDLVTNHSTPHRNKPATSLSMTSASISMDPNVRKKSSNILPARKSDIEDEITNNVILVLTEGKGLAQGEIGLAAIDLKRPVLILCQIIDTQNYMNTFKKINILNPAEIVIPSSFMDQAHGTWLYNTIKNIFPLCTILTASRKMFCENESKCYLKSCIVPECIPMLEQVLPKYYAVSAAVALLKHIESKHNVNFFSNTLHIEYEGIEKTMFVDAGSALGLELVLNSSLNTKNTLYDILNFCITTGGQRRLRSSILQPSTDIQLIHDRQEAVEEILINRERLFIFKNIIQKFTDVEQLYWMCTNTKVSKNTQCHSKLQGNYTLLLKSTLNTLPPLVDILEPFKSEYIFRIRKALSSPQYPKMLEIIEITINKESTRSKGFAESQFQRCFAIKSNINPLLDAARTVYSELIQEFYEKVKILGRQLGTEHLIPKNSYRRGFHVQVALKSIKNFDVKHPPSICKHVECFKSIMKFTTEELLVLNFRITHALNQVEMLTNQLLFEMFKELRKYINCIHNLCNSIADLDLIFSFAQYSMRSGLVRPMFGQCLDITNSRHPILDFINSTVPVANNIFASINKNLNIITGPNMGGKSIYIRQVALLQIIAQIGCFVPATKAQFRICDRLFTRIGFNDSIESNASTFVLEIKELNVILPSITKNSLIIIDELCRATSSEEGSSLAWAICEYIMQSCAFIFCATHNILITKLQDLYCNVVNYQMEALPVSNFKKTLFYTYKLQPGVTNIDDYGLTLARDVKMPENLVEHAIEIEKYLPRTKAAFLDNPSNKEDLILDNCIQKLLQMKDNDCLDMFELQLAVKEMMNKLKENATKNSDSSMEFIDSDEM